MTKTAINDKKDSSLISEDVDDNINNSSTKKAKKKVTSHKNKSTTSKKVTSAKKVTAQKKKITSNKEVTLSEESIDNSIIEKSSEESLIIETNSVVTVINSRKAKYVDIHKEAEDSKKYRLYHLTSSHLKKIEDKRIELGLSKQDFINPYLFFRKSGNYAAIIQSLMNLGLNNFHSEGKIVQEVKKILSDKKDGKGKNAWESFCNKKSQTKVESNVSSPEDKIIYNCGVIQRLGGLHPYGLRLAQCGACVDIREVPNKYDSNEIIREVRLRTEGILINDPLDLSHVFSQVNPTYDKIKRK